MSGMGYLATGFALIWLILACYLFWIGRRLTALRRRLEQLASGGGDAGDECQRLPDV
jgi:CcmD family protein